MGVSNFGINKPLIEQLAKQFNIQNFIETRTNLGRTSSWVTGILNEFHTIEIGEELFQETSNKYKHIKNVVANQTRDFNFKK